MDLGMAIRAEKRTLVEFGTDPIPRARDSIRGNAEILMLRFKVMKRERGFAFGVTAVLARTAFIGNGHTLELSPSKIDEILALASDIAEPASCADRIDAFFPCALSSRVSFDSPLLYR